MLEEAVGCDENVISVGRIEGVTGSEVELKSMLLSCVGSKETLLVDCWLPEVVGWLTDTKVVVLGIRILDEGTTVSGTLDTPSTEDEPGEDGTVDIVCALLVTSVVRDEVETCVMLEPGNSVGVDTGSGSTDDIMVDSCGRLVDCSIKLEVMVSTGVVLDSKMLVRLTEELADVIGS